MTDNDNPTATYGAKGYQSKTSAYKVGFIVEMFIEKKVRAFTEEQAKELAENRFRKKNQSYRNLGFTVGDIEQVTCEEVK